MSIIRKKILITGASGLLGGNLAYCLKDRYDLCGLYHTNEVLMEGVTMRACDLRDKEQAWYIIGEFRPDIVIHCAAEADVDWCEDHPDSTRETNILTTKHIVEILSKAGTKLIYISSDLVYDGIKGNFSEEDKPGPLNVYAQSKLDGENEALRLKRSVVLRTNFFGWNIYERESLGEWVINNLSKKKQIRGFTDAIFSSIYTFDFAELVDQIMKKDLCGIYNIGSNSALSKKDFLVMVAERLGLDRSLILSMSIDDFQFKAKRSKKVSLDVRKLQRDAGLRIPTIEETISHFIRDFRKDMPELFKSFSVEKKIYPQLDYISYGRQGIDEEDIQSVVEVLRSSNLTQGPKIGEFEKTLSQMTEAKYAVAVNSGTSALHLACLAVGVKPGDEVITPSNTFVASANCIVYCQGTPVFGDIDSKTYNISPEEIERNINKKTKAVICVHFAGQSCDMEEISRIVKDKEKAFGKKIFIIEDASHALGSLYKDFKVGSCKFSDMATLSFHPVKHITTGEGGTVLTNDTALVRKIRIFRSHGITNTADELIYKEEALEKGENRAKNVWYYEQQCLGYNYRITDIQCALGISQLKKLDRFIKKRRAIVDRYNAAFAGLKNLVTPFEAENCRSNFHLYVLWFDFDNLRTTRNTVIKKLRDNEILIQAHYIPVHTQPYYQDNFKTGWGDLPETEKYYRGCLSIPLYPYMSDADVEKVISNVKAIVRAV